jgi:hypothetical protein
MSCQDRFALEESLSTKRAHQNVQVTATCRTMPVTPTARKVWANPARCVLSCDAFPTRRFAEPVEVADGGFYHALKVPAVVNGALSIAEGGFASV